MEDLELLKVKSNRMFYEYCWMLKFVFLFYVMSKWDDVEYFVYMDMDLFFFFDLVCIFVENLMVFLYLIDYCNLLCFMFYYD